MSQHDSTQPTHIEASTMSSACSFRPGELWLDDKGVHINAHGGGVLLHEGVYYWFGEHKISGDAGNRAEVGVHVYSSRDLYQWKDEGIALSVSDDPASDIVKGCVLERPKVIYNAATKRFVMWFHLELKDQGYDAARAGVAISDHPCGPYTFLRSLRPNAGHWPENITDEIKDPATDLLNLEEFAAVRAGDRLRRDFAGGQMARDLTLYVDDDAKGYLLVASEDNFTLHLHELSDDYRDFTGRYARIFPARHNEAPAVFKKDGKYYLLSSGCTGWNPNPGRSAVADSIWGPWTDLGNPCRGTSEEEGTTFHSQSTFVLAEPGHPDRFIYLGDRWTPNDAIDGRYVWLPIEWEDGKPVLRWHALWSLAK